VVATLPGRTFAWWWCLARAPKDGMVREVSVEEGSAIEAGTVLLVID
jgi:multidrug efflux pump subunit AcrA (membrane-fusion protein)